uniref:RNase III domain-containing protein n=1 Tax=Trichuris muris TaxID=70415 RepID=A0A5S6QCK0_TRIMR
MFTSSTLYLAIGSFVKFLTELNGDVNLNTELYLLNDFDDQEKDVEEFEVPKVLGDLFESVVGDIYLDSGCSLVRESLFASPDEQAAQESIATSLVAADPTFSVFAFALGKQLSIACRQSVLSNSPSFHSARLEADAACLVFMPVMTNRRSDPRPYDWLSICIGLMNGRFLVYSLDMNLRLLICVRFAYGPVKAVDHLSLLSTIKRRHQARYVNTSETDCSTELVYEKWNALNSWKAIASAGVCRRTLWERAVAITPNASQSEPTLRKAGSFHGSYCCVGSEPFISCLRTTSDIKQVQSLINDTVNRIRSSVNVPYHIVDYVLGTSKGAPSSSVDILADRAAAGKFSRWPISMLIARSNPGFAS